MFFGLWNPEGRYVEGISLTRYSDDQLRELYESPELKEQLVIVSVTDDDLRGVPAIKMLIEQSLRQEFSLNIEGTTQGPLEEIFSNHNYVAKKYSEKYGTNQDIYFTRSEPDDDVKTRYPNSYEYQFDARFFKYGAKFYSFSDSYIIVTEEEPPLIGVHVLQNAPNKFVELTDDDLESIPTVKKALEKIGTIQENIQVQTGLPESELEKYQKWSERLGFSDGRTMFYPSMFEYKGENYMLSFWVS
jgi:hypothetical protein